MNLEALQKELEELDELLYDLGIYQTQEGYILILIAIKLILKQPELLGNLTKELYPKIAMQRGCRDYTVERNIRFSISKAWDANPAIFTDLAHRTITQQPTTGDFLCMLHNFMKKVKKKS